MRFKLTSSIGRLLFCLLAVATAYGQERAANAPDGAGAAASVEIIDFGADRMRTSDRVCSDARFVAPGGGGLEGSGLRVHGTHNDATDCRQLFARGAIELRDSFAQNLAGLLPRPDRATVFVDPVQQADVDIVWFDGQSLGGGSGVPVVYTFPDHHLVGVHAADTDYACVVRLADADGAPNLEDPAYVEEPVRGGVQASLASIPASPSRDRTRSRSATNRRSDR